MIIAIGGMRLSTERDRDGERAKRDEPQRVGVGPHAQLKDEARAIAVLHAAFDAGITFLDTADAYCRDASEAGHNERLIAGALAGWNGDRSRDPAWRPRAGSRGRRGDWVADGRARHLVAACEASRRALGVDRIHLYQLHAPDPRTPLVDQRPRARAL